MNYKKILTILGALGVLFSISLTSGCNTSRGLGRDVERAGEEIQDAAR